MRSWPLRDRSRSRWREIASKTSCRLRALTTALACRRVECFRGVSKRANILLIGWRGLMRRIERRTKGSFRVADECKFSALIGRNEAFDCSRLGDFWHSRQFARNCFSIIMGAREHLRRVRVDRRVIAQLQKGANCLGMLALKMHRVEIKLQFRQ
jgi:hypothetical protein